MSAPAIERVTREGAALALHVWMPASPRAALLHVHGIQSHAAWLFEAGPALRDHGIAVFALDRRGFGKSEGARFDTVSGAVWVDDYLHVAQRIRERHSSLPLALLGQSFGGLIAGAVAAHPDSPADCVLLQAPALGQIHARRSAEQIEQIRRPPDPAAMLPVPLQDDWYARRAEALAFMKSDPLMARAVTARCFSAQLELEERLASHPGALARRPAAMIVPRADRIVDLGVARAAFHALAPGGLVIEVPSDDHFLDFADCREQVWRLVATFAISRGFGELRR